MSEIQVLVATMHQSDFSLGEKMKIPCDAVFANQADYEAISQSDTNGKKWKMISTATRGVGLNRNLALMMAEAEIVLFADDDVSYYDGLVEGIKEGFRHWPDADVVIFSVDFEKNGQICEKRRVPQKRMRVWNSLKYGTIAIAAKRSALLKNNITFNQCFGGGCLYGSGEDSLFIKTCFDKKLKVYSYNYVLGICKRDSSSWFKGFNEKYFFDKGALFSTAFPVLKYLVIPLFAAKFKKSKLPFFKRMRLMFMGSKNVKALIPYSQAKT